LSIYSDLNSINPTNKSLLTDAESVYQSLYNIFSTTPGERDFLEEFGFELEDELFEFVDDVTSLEIFRRVLEAVQRWEQRVIVDKANTKITAYPDENKFVLELYFSLRGVGDQLFRFVGSFTN